jgi:hypothetical protein
VESEYFGYWPGKGKKCLAFIDKIIDRMSGYSAKGVTPEVATELVLSNIAVASANSKKVMICGGAAKEVIAEIAEAAKAQLSETEVIFGGAIGSDPTVVRGMAECDAVIIAEQLDKSGLSAAVTIKERAEGMDKRVIGVIVHK